METIDYWRTDFPQTTQDSEESDEEITKEKNKGNPLKFPGDIFLLF